MLVISTRDFRAHQTKFLDMANRGESIVLKTRGNGSFRLVPVKEDDEVIARTDLMVKLKEALQEVKDHVQGKTALQSAEELLNEL